MNYQSLKKFKGFKLVSLDVKKHKILGSNTFNFIDLNDSPKAIYFSLIIGPNGTGKSVLLRYVLSLFRRLAKEDFSRMSEKFCLTYLNDGVIFKLTNQPLNIKNTDKKFIPELNRIFLYANDKKVEFKVENAGLPERLVANSIMLTDKFIVPRNDKEKKEFPIYRYLGVRNRPQSASTRSYTRKTIEFIISEIKSDRFQRGLNHLIEFLGYENSVIIEFKTSNTKLFFNGSVEPSDIHNYFIAIRQRYKGKIAPFKLSHYERIKEDEELLKKLCAYLNHLKSSGRLNKIYRSPAKHIQFDILNSSIHDLIKKEYELLDLLRKLGMVNVPEVKFKNGESITLQNSSSGEFHFFSTMVGLMATVRKNSLVLIDEPEISLHPNWQMNYVHYLSKLFEDEIYESCQIVIATHSHFLVSDVQGPCSTIIGLNRNDENELKTISITTNTFGWSAEEVLLEIFRVPTTRNLYVSEKIGEILDLIAQPGNKKALVQKMVNELVERNLHKLSSEDPLKKIIDKLIEKYAK